MKSGADAGRKGDEGKGGAQPRIKNANVPAARSSDKRDDGTASGPEASVPTTAATSASSTTTNDPAPSSTSTAPSSDRNAAGDMDDFLKNATKILKIMAEKQGGQSSGPSMKMLKKAVRRMESRMALVDSGATHPLREAEKDEWLQAPEVDVVIAGDGVTTMRQNIAGTLLTEPEKVGRKPQTIVPVGNLISLLGYELLWTKKKCVLRAPDGREEVLKMSSGCPEVNEATALELIAKIEQEKVAQLERAVKESQQTLMRAMKVEKDPQWERSLRAFVHGGKFEDGFRAVTSMPWATDVMNEDLIKAMADLPQSEREAWDLMLHLGFNRRMRKRLMHKDWIVKFYSGKRSYNDKMFKAFENNGTMVLDVDVLRMNQLNMLGANKGAMALMLWGAATGRIAGPRDVCWNTSEQFLRACSASCCDQRGCENGPEGAVRGVRRSRGWGRNMFVGMFSGGGGREFYGVATQMVQTVGGSQSTRCLPL